MVRAWYMSRDGAEEQRAPHRPPDCREVGLDQLAALGVRYWSVPTDDYEKDPTFVDIKGGRGYTYTDVISVSPQTLPSYEEKIKSFFEEHLHADEEVRFVLEGSGYFDVRSHDDQWIRIEVVKGDLLVLPAGIYHRFTLDRQNYIKAVRLFKGQPVWTPVNRPADSHPARLAYLQQLN